MPALGLSLGIATAPCRRVAKGGVDRNNAMMLCKYTMNVALSRARESKPRWSRCRAFPPPSICRQSGIGDELQHELPALY